MEHPCVNGSFDIAGDHLSPSTSLGGSDEEHTASHDLVIAVEDATTTFVSWPGRLLSPAWYQQAGFFPC